jgi:hypothetical protein
MPFGLFNSPATFGLLIETILTSLTYESCLLYIDGVIVIVRTFQVHLLNLLKLFQWLREARLNLSPGICKVCTNYRCLISGFATILKPLIKLTEEKQAFQWAPEMEADFRTLPLFLPTRQPGESAIVDTNASNVGIGGVLSQIQEVRERVIVYYSKALSKAERNYRVAGKNYWSS